MIAWCWDVQFDQKGWRLKPLKVVVSIMFYFHRYLAKGPILTSIFFNWVGSTSNQKNFEVLLASNFDIGWFLGETSRLLDTFGLPRAPGSQV